MVIRGVADEVGKGGGEAQVHLPAHTALSSDRWSSGKDRVTRGEGSIPRLASSPFSALKRCGFSVVSVL